MSDEHAEWRQWARLEPRARGEPAEGGGGEGGGAARLAVLLTGVSGVGKDTVAAALTAGHGFRRLAIGDALKDVCHALAARLWEDEALPRAAFDDPERKTRVFDEGGAGPRARFSPTRLCYELGTCVLRAHLGEDVWVRALLRGAEAAGDRIVVTDVRFPADLEALRAHLVARGFRVLLARIVPAPDEPRPALPADAHVAELPAELEIPSSHRAGPAELCARAVPLLLAALGAAPLRAP